MAACGLFFKPCAVPMAVVRVQAETTAVPSDAALAAPLTTQLTSGQSYPDWSAVNSAPIPMQHRTASDFPGP
jgi:hypothetical protein